MFSIINDRARKIGALDEIYHRVASNFSNLCSSSDCQRFMAQTASEYGLSNIAYLAINTPIIAENEPYLAVTYSEEWVLHYRRSEFQIIDPVLKEGFSSIMPIDWRNFNRTSSKMRRLFGEAVEFRVGQQGLTFPIRGRFGEAALLTITSDESNIAWESTLGIYKRDFQVLAYHIHQAILRIEGIVAKPIQLAPREIECLRWASRGKTVSDIAIILSISDRTVRFYLDTARNKLDACNITHAVTKALQLNLLTNGV